MRNLRKCIIFSVIVFLAMVALVAFLVFDIVPTQYELAAYLLIISLSLFFIYVLLFIVEAINENKKEIVPQVTEDHKQEIESEIEVFSNEEDNFSKL